MNLARFCCQPRSSALMRHLVTLLLVISAIAPARAQQAVARVTLLAGAVQRIDTHEQAHLLDTGSAVFEGDRIQAGQGALVHLRFMDGAHVGLRENSELKIAAYRTAPAAIDLQLVKGAVRQITGSIAKQQPQSFRLNTPIAAIGVRGTDFIAGYSADNTFALLLEGAITVGSTQCQGECRPELVSEPQTLATIDGQGRVATRLLAPSEIDQLAGHPQLARTTATATATAAPILSAVDDKAETLPPLSQVVPPADGPTALVWSRWLATGRLPEDFAAEAGVMEEQADYRIRATNLSYALWRHEPAGSSWVPGSGNLSFSLGQSAARYTNGYLDLPVTIERGILALDLTNRGFETRLEGRLAATPPNGLQSLANTQTLLNLSGTIDSQGRLSALTPTATLYGAVALDKSGAGYLFSSKYANGKIEGITSWVRR